MFPQRYFLTSGVGHRSAASGAVRVRVERATSRIAAGSKTGETGEDSIGVFILGAVTVASLLSAAGKNNDEHHIENVQEPTCSDINPSTISNAYSLQLYT